MKQDIRRVSWENDSTEDVIKKIRASDGFPGSLSQFSGEKYYMYEAYKEGKLGAQCHEAPGSLIGVRNQAVLVKTKDAAVWIGHLRKTGKENFKLPSLLALPEDITATLPRYQLSHKTSVDYPTYRDTYYTENGDVGFVFFDFYNGAMRVDQSERLTACIEYAKTRPTKVIVLQNNQFVFSNGINLNTIEAADDQAQEAWKSINAINDAVFAILSATNHTVITVMGGNAGAGGVALARAADIVICPPSSVLNPHYKLIGLYGSEYWTHIFPKAVGWEVAMEIADRCKPMTAENALDVGFIDFLVDRTKLRRFLADLVADQIRQHHERQRAKQEEFESKQQLFPFEINRTIELTQMKKNMFENNWGFAEKRHKLVHKLK